MSMVHALYIAAVSQRTGVGQELAESLTDWQVALMMPILLVVHYVAFATDKRHFAIEYEFMQRPVKRWLGNTIVLLWFLLGMAWITIEMAIK